MATQKRYFVIEVLNYKPTQVGFALSEKDGWYVGPHRFCGIRRAQKFPSRDAAQRYLDARYDGDRYEYEIQEFSEWVR